MSNETASYQTASLVASLALSAGKDPAMIAVAGCDEVNEVVGLAFAIAEYYAMCEKKAAVVGCGRVAAQEAGMLGVSNDYDTGSLANGRFATKRTAKTSEFNDKIDILPFGELDDVRDEIIANEMFCNMLLELSKTHDHIVVAAPFAHKAIDASVIACAADVTMLAAVLGKTRRKNLRKASEALKRSGANIAGVCVVGTED